MRYAAALRVLARLEGVAEEEVEAVVASKFEYVVTCQIYGKLKSGMSSKETVRQEADRWKAASIDALRHQFASNLSVAYVDECAAGLRAPSALAPLHRHFVPLAVASLEGILATHVPSPLRPRRRRPHPSSPPRPRTPLQGSCL